MLQIAALFPHIHSLSLQGNGLAQLSAPNTADVFRCLQSLDLHQNRLSDFSEVLKLGEIRTLKRLFLMKNGLRTLHLPDCAPTDYVAAFAHLEELNLRENPLEDEMATFNELDKLERLRCLCQSPAGKGGFEEMFARAVALISGLRQCNKIVILPKMRRDAEVDIWKQLGMEYVAAQQGNEVERAAFQRKCRAYPRIVKSEWNLRAIFPLSLPFVFLSSPPIAAGVRARLTHCQSQCTSWRGGGNVDLAQIN